MGTVRSAWSLMVSKGRRSSSQRSQCSILSASPSSSFRRGVTLGEGMAEDTWLSMFSKTIFRIWGAFCPSSPFVKARSSRSPLYRCSRRSIFVIWAFQATSLSASRFCQTSSFAGLTAAFLSLGISQHSFVVTSSVPLTFPPAAMWTYRGVPHFCRSISRSWGAARSKSSHISCVHAAVPAAAVRFTSMVCCGRT